MRRTCTGVRVVIPFWNAPIDHPRARVHSLVVGSDRSCIIETTPPEGASVAFLTSGLQRTASVLLGNRVAVVMPAYRAEKTLAQCYAAIPHDVVDMVLLVDDGSDDATLAVARELGLITHRHPRNLGYGANQKTCYRAALADGADIVVMLHPDYQYEPRLITAMAGMIASGVYDVVIGSRILGNTALRGGMPLYKYVFNRVLTAVQNLMVGMKLSEFHTGYRAFSRRVLTSLPLLANSQDFIFDNQMLVQAHAFNMRIGEISCPTKYFEDASEINFSRSVVYGLGVLKVSLQYMLWRAGVATPRIFSDAPQWRLPAADDVIAPVAVG